MDEVIVIQPSTICEIGDAIIDTTGRTEAFKLRDVPRLIREDVYNSGFSAGHTDGYHEGYDDGFAEGEASGGGGAEFDYIAYWDEMLGDRDTEVQGGYVYDEETGEEHWYAPTSSLLRETYYNSCVIIPQGVLTDYGASNPYDLVVIARAITFIAESVFDNATECTVVCLAAAPPTLSWQGAWSADGGNYPPIAIYVPDGSVDAYKEDTTWAEYADAVRPISEFEYFVVEG